jgi:uncharacterized protein YmfQ (DUF2313 family)
MAQEFEKFAIPQKYFDRDYLKMIKGLLPRGDIWGWDAFDVPEFIQDVIAGVLVWQDSVVAPTEYQDVINADAVTEGSILARYCSVIASELTRLEAKAWDLLRQEDPGLANELLDDWERVLGLPGPCRDIAQNITDRQRAAHAKKYGEYQVTNNAFWVQQAEDLGFVVTVEGSPIDTTPRIIGKARMGAERMTADRGGYSALKITVISGTGNYEQMQCIFNDIKPAHAIIVWEDLRP